MSDEDNGTIIFDVPLRYQKPEMIREKLKKGFIDFGAGREIRDALQDIAVRTYVPKYKELYFDFLNNEHCVKFDRVHPQDKNSPYAFQMFSISTQHIYADSIEQLLDIAIEIKIKMKIDEFKHRP